MSDITLDKIRQWAEEFETEKQEYRDFVSSGGRFPSGRQVHYQVTKQLVGHWYIRALERCTTRYNRALERCAFRSRGSLATDATPLSELKTLFGGYTAFLQHVTCWLEKQDNTFWPKNLSARTELRWMLEISRQVTEKLGIATQKETIESINSVEQWLQKEMTKLIPIARAARPSPPRSRRTPGVTPGRGPNRSPRAGEWYGQDGGAKVYLAINNDFDATVTQFEEFWDNNVNNILDGTNADDAMTLQQYLQTALKDIHKQHLADSIVPGRTGGSDLDKAFALENANNFDDHMGFQAFDTTWHGYNEYKKLLGGELSPEEANPEPGFSNLEKAPSAFGKLKGGGRPRHTAYSNANVELQAFKRAIQFERGSPKECTDYDTKMSDRRLKNLFETRLETYNVPIHLEGNYPSDNSPVRHRVKEVVALETAKIPAGFDDLRKITTDEELISTAKELKSKQVSDLWEAWNTSYWAISEPTKRKRERGDWIIDGRVFNAKDFTNKQQNYELLAKASALWLRQIRLLWIYNRMFERWLCSLNDLIEIELMKADVYIVHQSLFNLWDLIRYNKDLARATARTKLYNVIRRQARTRFIAGYYGIKKNYREAMGLSSIGPEGPKGLEAYTPKAPARERKQVKSRPTPKTPTIPRTPKNDPNKDPNVEKPPRPTVPSVKKHDKLADLHETFTDIKGAYERMKAEAIDERQKLDPDDPGDLEAWKYWNQRVTTANGIIFQMQDSINQVEAGKWEVSTTAGTKRPCPTAPNEVLDDGVVTPPRPKKRRLPTGINDLSPGSHPGEHDTPSVSRVLVGSPPRFGSDPRELEEEPPTSTPVRGRGTAFFDLEDDDMSDAVDTPTRAVKTPTPAVRNTRRGETGKSPGTTTTTTSKRPIRVAVSRFGARSSTNTPKTRRQTGTSSGVPAGQVPSSSDAIPEEEEEEEESENERLKAAQKARQEALITARLLNNVQEKARKVLSTEPTTSDAETPEGSGAESDSRQTGGRSVIPNEDGWPALKTMMRRTAIALRARQAQEEILHVPADDTPRSTTRSFWALPNTQAAIDRNNWLKLQADAKFPRGFEQLDTPGDNLLCSIWALMLSMRMQYPELDQPTAGEISDLIREDPMLVDVKEMLDNEPEGSVRGASYGGGTRNLPADFVGAVFMTWARKHKYNFVLDLVIRPHHDDPLGPPPTQYLPNGTVDENAKYIYHSIEGPGELVSSARHLYVFHNNMGHYSGIAPLPLQTRALLAARRALETAMSQVEAKDGAFKAVLLSLGEGGDEMSDYSEEGSFGDDSGAEEAEWL